jgi:hypothetical protein
MDGGQWSAIPSTSSNWALDCALKKRLTLPVSKGFADSRISSPSVQDNTQTRLMGSH